MNHCITPVSKVVTQRNPKISMEEMYDYHSHLKVKAPEHAKQALLRR
jgi:hypothetical protein